MADQLLDRVNDVLRWLTPGDPEYDLVSDLYAEVVHLRRDLADCRSGDAR